MPWYRTQLLGYVVYFDHNIVLETYCSFAFTIVYSIKQYYLIKIHLFGQHKRN